MRRKRERASPGYRRMGEAWAQEEEARGRDGSRKRGGRRRRAGGGRRPPSSMYHKSLVQLMITGAPALEKMTVELIKDPLSKGQNGSEDPGFNMPSKGQWAPPVVGRSLGHGNVTIYEWEAEVKREEDREDLDSLALSRL